MRWWYLFTRLYQWLFSIYYFRFKDSRYFGRTPRELLTLTLLVPGVVPEPSSQVPQAGAASSAEGDVTGGRVTTGGQGWGQGQGAEALHPQLAARPGRQARQRRRYVLATVVHDCPLRSFWGILPRTSSLSHLENDWLSETMASHVYFLTHFRGIKPKS